MYIKIIITEEEIKNNSNNDALGELVRKKYWDQLKDISRIKNNDETIHFEVDEDGFVVSIIKSDEIEE